MAERGSAHPKRLLWIVVLALGLAALALWGSSRFTWATQRRVVPGSREVTQALTGAQAVPALVPLALLALAAIAAVVSTGGWWRRLVGVVAALAGVAALFPVLQDFSSPVLPRAIAVLGALLLLAVGVLLVLVAGSLPRLGATYSAPGKGSRPVDEDARLWHALSDGDDPTIGR